MTYGRELAGRELKLEASGWTYGPDPRRSIFVLADKETGSLWFPMEDQGDRLVAIEGPRRGSVLLLLPMTRSTWGAWKARHPGSMIMMPPSP